MDSGGEIRDLSGHIRDVSGAALGDASLNRLRELDLSGLPVVSSEVRIGPCVGNVGKIVCIGLNYSDHAIEAGMEVPPEPVVFMKATSAINGPYDNVVIPRNSTQTDWEVELGVIIGKQARYISERDAVNHVAGYCVINDISERTFQLARSGQWVKGKSSDTFAPIGPWVVTRDEIEDPQRLRLWLDVDGKRYQDGTTETMIYGVDFLIGYLSQFMTLQPGDIIATGTPAGVGVGQHPPTFLRAGQTVQLGIDGLGVQKQGIVALDSNLPQNPDR